MKRFSTLLVLFLSAMMFFSSNKTQADDTNVQLYPKMVLAEMFYGANTRVSAQFFNQEAIQQYIFGKPNLFIPIKFYNNWPEGNDEIYNANPEMIDARFAFYGLNTIPRLVVDGDVYENGKDTMLIMPSEREKMGIQSTPYLIAVSHKIEGDLVKATVKIKSDVAANNKKLQVALVEYSYEYEAGTGEREHYFIARDMDGNGAGKDFSLKAGEEKTFEVVFPKKNYKEAELYIVAWMHGNNYKTVEQAGTNFNELKQGATISSKTKYNYFYVEKGKTTDIVLDIKNQTNHESTFDLKEAGTLHQDSNNITLKFEPATVKLGPGETKEITLKVTSKDQANYSLAIIRPKLSAPGIDVSSSILLGTMTKDPKHVVYFNLPNMKSARTVYNWLSQYKDFRKDLVFAPIFEDDMFMVYDNKTVETATFLLSLEAVQAMFTSYRVPTQILNILNNDGRVLLSTQTGLYNLFEAQPPYNIAAPWRDIIVNNLNINKLTPKQVFKQNPDGIAFEQFTMHGVEEDIITGDIQSMSANTITENEQIPYAMWFTEEIRLDDSESAASPILEYESPLNNYAGVRKELENGKLVFLSFNPASIDKEADRANLLEKIYNWLLDKTSDEAKMLITGQEYDNVDFGSVKVGESQTKTLSLENKGRKDLVIESVKLFGNKAFSMEAVDVPITLGLNQKVEINLTFTPDAKNKDYDAELTIKSNAHMKKTVKISLAGNGVGNEAGPNPTLTSNKVDFGTVKVKSVNKKKVTLSNAGDLPFEVTSITIKDDPKVGFEIAEIEDIPFILEEGDKKELNIKFEPIESGNYNAKAEINTNAKNKAKLVIDITGIATENNKVEDEVGNDNFSMRTMPNPMTTSGSILVKANNAINVEIQLVDANGRVIDNIYNSSSFIGESSIKLNVETLSNGLFFVKATVDGQVYSLPVVIKK